MLKKGFVLSKKQTQTMKIETATITKIPVKTLFLLYETTLITLFKQVISK